MPKKVLLFTLLAASSVIGGVLFSNRLYARKVEAFLASKTKAVKRRNKNLEQERAEYRDLFEKLTNQLDQAADKSSERELTKESAGSFNQLATVRYPRLLEGLQTMQDLLEEKEFQLWEKEGLLEYQEERLMNTEDLEQEMTGYINKMAATLLARNQTLPAGLVEEPYFGQNPAADDPAPGNLHESYRSAISTAHNDDWSP